MSNRDFGEFYESVGMLLESRKAEGYEVKLIEDHGDVMGDLIGWQFDSPQKGGYIYFWSSGLVGSQLVDYDSGQDLIEDSTGELDDSEIKSLLANLDRLL